MITYLQREITFSKQRQLFVIHFIPMDIQMAWFDNSVMLRKYNMAEVFHFKIICQFKNTFCFYNERYYFQQKIYSSL